MDIPAIRADVGRALGQIDGLNVVTTKPGNVIAPAAILGSYAIAPHAAMSEQLSTLTWEIVVVIADSASGAIEDLDAYLSDEGELSLILALEEFDSDVWSSLTVQASAAIEEITVGATSFIGCRFPVEIFC